MKKIFFTFFILNASLSAMAFMPVTDVGAIHNHNMQMIEQQKFRMEVIDDYKSVQEEKERYQKRNGQPKPVIQQQLNNENSKLINEDGEIKIKY